MSLTVEQASNLIRLPMACLCREYPSFTGHVLEGPNDLRSPRALHPSFYGCFDWHSAVHSHWTMLRLTRLFDLPEAEDAHRLLAGHLGEGLDREAEYLERYPTFERMYGWAWLLKLVQEIDLAGEGDWLKSISRLERTVLGLIEGYLPRLTYPIRVGTHANTAFALTLIFDYAQHFEKESVMDLVSNAAHRFFEGDREAPVRWEPSGSDFFSPSLCEALLMSRVLQVDQFSRWFDGFLPSVPFCPVTVSDRSDPQIGHLDGLNLSRAWCLAGISTRLPFDHPLQETITLSSETHLEASLPHIASGHYSGEHWLATFATLALT